MRKFKSVARQLRRGNLKLKKNSIGTETLMRKTNKGKWTPYNV